MSATVKPIPDGYPRVSAYLFIRGAAKALEYYAKVFGAKERMRLAGPGGMIMHAEIQIGDSVIMLSDENPAWQSLSPESVGGTPVVISMYCEDVDKTFAQALAAGAKQMRPVETAFYGDRGGSLIDPFGHQWHLASRVENLTPEEIGRRAAEMFKGGPPQP